ncbi:MAG: FimV/HubP family polar landmark protein [Acidiferrobacterales bacterium]
MNRPTRVMSRAARLCVLGAVLTAMPGVAHALGLGNLTVDSALNEPLKAQIDFTSVNKKELKSLNITLAPRGDFEAAGIEKLPYLSDIKFTVAKRLDGRSFLQLTSEHAIREPFLHFLLQVEWAGGRLIREFTALIDPPYLLAGRTPPVQAPQTAAAPPPAEPITAPPPAEPAAAPPPEAPVAAALPADDASTLTMPTVPEVTAEAAVAPEPTLLLGPPPEPAGTVESMPEIPEFAATTEPEPVAAPEPVEAAMVEPDLLGPPEMGDPSVAISPDTGWPVVAAAELIEAEPAEPTMPEPTTMEVAMAALPEQASMAEPFASWANVSQYEVKRGDTLWHIAQTIRIDGSFTTEQVIMALFEANRGAFFEDNVNNVWAGKVLIVPEREQIEALSVQAARKVFLAQYGEWQEYKIKLASASQTIKVAAAETQGVPADALPTSPSTMGPTEQMAVPAGESTETQMAKREVGGEPFRDIEPEASATPSEQESVQPEAKETQPKESIGTAAVAARAKPPRDLLKIVRAAIERESLNQRGMAEGEAAADKEQLALAERATAMDESLDSRQMEQEEMGQRIDTVGSQIEKQKRLMEIENEALAQTQEPGTPSEQEKPATPPATVGAATSVAKPATKPAAQPAPAKPSPQTKAAQKPPAKAAKPKKKKRRIAPPKPPEEKGILATVQEMFGDFMLQAVAGVIALVGGLILLTYMRRRRQAEAEFEESILTDTGATSEEAATTDSGSQATTSGGNTSFLSDFSQGGMGNISTDEVDPLAETEVYLAYGRDEQAEEILKDAVAKDPSRHELKVKLLEIYHQRNDVGAFETLAEELYAAQEGRGGDLWNRVVDMGRRLNPENPMFQGVAPPVPEAPAMSEPMPEAGFGDAMAPAEPEAPSGLDFEPGQMEAPAEAEAGLELDVAAEAAPVEPPTDTDLEFDLDMQAAAEAEKHGGPHLGDTDELAAQDIAAAVAEGEAAEALGLGEEPADNVVDFEVSERQPEAEAEIATEEPVAAAADSEVDWAAAEAAVAEAEAVDGAVEAPADTGPTDDSQQWDETATKLDLAKAYVDMGDAEGARSILDEVLAEGNEEQKKQAAELAAQIA